MSAKPRSAMSDYEFIRAARDERRECERDYNVIVSTVIWIDTKRCVLELSLMAHQPAADPGGPPLAAYKTSWPNASTQSFTCCLFQAYVQLRRLVEDSLRPLMG